jgi:hypothetical protein
VGADAIGPSPACVGPLQLLPFHAPCQSLAFVPSQNKSSLFVVKAATVGAEPSGPIPWLVGPLQLVPPLVSPSHRELSRPFQKTWIRGPLEPACAAAVGAEPSAPIPRLVGPVHFPVVTS